MEIIDQISQWIQEYHGIFTFGTHTPMDESVFDSLSKYLLDRTDGSTKNAVFDVSYLKSFSLKNSVFVFRSSDIMSAGNYEQGKQIIRTISNNCIDKNNIVLLQVPVYQTSDGNFIMKDGGSGVMMASNMACILSNGKLSFQKLRWINSDDYNDSDILQFVRDYKLNLLL